MPGKLPPFTNAGLLPPGDYLLTLDELRASHLVTGAGVASEYWDTEWRGHLVDNVSILVSQLWQVGVQEIYLDGSFVEDKDHPNDIDGYFECDVVYFATRGLENALNELDPYRTWTWDPHLRRPDRNSAKAQLPMWHQYHVEFYPHWPGARCGIVDEHGADQPFPAAFRKRRFTFEPKGIVKVIR